jgi:hydrogenase small subunit
MAAGAVVTNYSSEIADALQQATDGSKEVVWLQGQCCSGCTVSTLQGDYPSLETALKDFKLEVTFHPTLMAPAGDAAVESMSNDPDVLIVEGSIPMDIPEAATVGRDAEGNPKPVVDWVKELAPNAGVVVGVGNCAAYGGWPAAENRKRLYDLGENVTGARGLQFEGRQNRGVFGPDFTSEQGLPVVNVAGCPPHPDYVLLTLATVLNGYVPDLDEYNRPMPFYEPNIHDQCSLRGDFDTGEWAEHPGDDGCLYKIGCAGPYTYCDDSVRLWNGGTSVCRDAGAPCIGCMEPGFWDRFSPFYEPIERQNLFGVNVEGAGIAAAGAAVVGVGAHMARKATGYGKEEEEESSAAEPPEGDSGGES